MDPVTIPLRDRRQNVSTVVDLVTHVGAAVPLLAAGYAALTGAGGTDRLLGYVEIVVAALLLMAVAREAKELRHGGGNEEYGINWLNVFAAGVMFCEVWQKWEVVGRFWSPTFLTAVVTLGIGILNPRLARRRARRRQLVLDDSGVEMRTGRFRRVVAARWDELESIAFEPAGIRFRRRSGAEHAVGLRFFANAADASAALARHAAAAGVRIDGAPPAPRTAHPAHAP